MLLLDCTLRDDWEFGYDNIINIYERLISARIDIVEVGFIDARRPYDVNRSIFPDTASVGKTFERLGRGSSIIVGMIDYGTCPIENIEEQKYFFLERAEKLENSFSGYIFSDDFSAFFCQINIAFQAFSGA